MFLESSARVKASLFMAVSAAVLMFGYEVIRSVSNSLFKQTYGVENLPIIMALVPLFLIPIIYLYNLSLSRFGSKRTFYLSSVLSGLSIFVCYLLVLKGYKIGSAMVYLLRESYVILIIEQVWSFVNSTLTQDEAKKYNGLILSISSLGAISGGFLVHFLAEHVGTVNLLIISAAMCIPTAIIGFAAYTKNPVNISPKSKDKQRSGSFGLSLFKEQKMLYLILIMIIASQVYSTIVTLNFQSELQDSYPLLDQQTAVSGLFFGSLHVLSFVFQFLLSPVLLASFSVSTLHLAIPLLHLLSALVVIVFPSLWTAGFSLMMFKSVDYSIFRAAKEILYIPLTFDARFRAKKIIDVFGYRFSKSATSFLIGILQNLGLPLAGAGFGVVSFFSAVSWFLFVVPIMKASTVEQVELT
ncbi:MAG: Npt1/Npt2 family nucleotide transporter [Oligoflexales bacterium]